MKEDIERKEKQQATIIENQACLLPNHPKEIKCQWQRPCTCRAPGRPDAHVSADGWACLGLWFAAPVGRGSSA
jgi:hypothetical protein